MSAASAHAGFLRQTLERAAAGARAGDGGPFAAAIVRGDQVLALECNRVTSTLDPTAHAEVQAIRVACQAIGDFQLLGCVLYASCEPCPMCLGAIHWARVDAVYYAATRDDAAAGGFDDAKIYQQLAVPGAQREIPFVQIPIAGAKDPFEVWRSLPGKIEY